MKSSFMGGLNLKQAPKIVTKNDIKPSNARHKSLDSKSHTKNSSLNSLNSMINQSSVLSGNSLNNQQSNTEIVINHQL